MSKHFKHLAIYATLSVASGAAFASAPASYLGSTGSYTCPPCAPGETARPGLNQALLQGTTVQTMLTITNSISSRASFVGGPMRLSSLGEPRTGMAAGDASSKLNVWGSYGFISREDTKAGQQTDADIDNPVIGADYQIAPNLVLGVSGAFDDGDGNIFNAVGFAKTRFENKGYSIAPYVAWQINQNWSLDAAIGWGEGKFKTNSPGGPGSADSDRMFGGANLSYTRWMDNWQFLGKGSYMYAEEEYENSKFNGVTVANTGVTNKLSQLRLGAQAGYWLGGGWLPYAGLAFVSDSDVSPKVAPGIKWDKQAWVGTVGINYFSAKNDIYGGIAINDESRNGTTNTSVLLNINFRF